jgi:hypothetical protein
MEINNLVLLLICIIIIAYFSPNNYLTSILTILFLITTLYFGEDVVSLLKDEFKKIVKFNITNNIVDSRTFKTASLASLLLNAIGISILISAYYGINITNNYMVLFGLMAYLFNYSLIATLLSCLLIFVLMFIIKYNQEYISQISTLIKKLIDTVVSTFYSYI